jgi:hypothetical protein
MIRGVEPAQRRLAGGARGERAVGLFEQVEAVLLTQSDDALGEGVVPRACKRIHQSDDGKEGGLEVGLLQHGSRQGCVIAIAVVERYGGNGALNRGLRLPRLHRPSEGQDAVVSCEESAMVGQ